MPGNYVYPDTVRRVSELIKSEIKSGEYNKKTDPVEFSDKLTADMYSIYHDGH